jgi:ATP synthase F1 complex assembly factor 2
MSASSSSLLLPRLLLRRRSLVRHPLQRLSFSSTRRRRFYREVNVQAVPAPWESASSNKSNQDTTVASGISAGVDGTQSASGVGHQLETNAASLRAALTPRWPGLVLPPSADDRATTNSDRGTTATATALSWHTVTLDSRPLRTPLGQTLAVPSERLAAALAVEWNAVTHSISPSQMPLMTLVCTTLDQLTQAAVAAKTRDDSLQYFHTDTTCYYADPLQDRVLHRKQQEHWTPVHEFLSNRLLTMASDAAATRSSDDYRPATVLGAQEAMLSRQLPHSPSLAEACRTLVDHLDVWHLQCLASLCRETKSLLLSLAILLDYYQDDETLQSAMDAARVEEEFQIAVWGLVEGGHDYDRLNCAVQIQAAVVLKDCLRLDCLTAEGSA